MTGNSNFGPVTTDHVDEAIALSKQALIDHSSLIIKINPNQQELGELIDMNELTRLTQGRFGSSQQVMGEVTPEVIHTNMTMTQSNANLMKETKELSEQ